MEEKDFGIVYVATGKRFVDEAIESAKSIKMLNPNLPIALFADYQPQSEYLDHEFVIEQPLFSVKDKMMCLLDSPFYYSVFVDSDTHFISDPSDLRGVFDNYDFAACHAPQRIYYDKESVPNWFPEVNGGLLCYSLSDKNKAFFALWKQLYENDEKALAENKEMWPHGMHEQPTLRQALFESNLKVYILPPEYNFRTIFPNFAGGKIHMLHGRMKKLERFKKSINTTEFPRVISPDEQTGSFYILLRNTFMHKINRVLYAFAKRFH